MSDFPKSACHIFGWSGVFWGEDRLHGIGICVAEFSYDIVCHQMET